MKIKKFVLPLLLLCVTLFTMVGCTKTIDYQVGTYTASNIEVYDDLFIDFIQLELYSQESADYERIAISLVCNGNDIIATDCGLTYNSKELKIAFDFDDKTGYIIAKAKQKGDDIFIEGNLTIDNNSVDIKLNKIA